MVRVLDFEANLHRDDLAASGFGGGRHGFALDLAGLGLSADSRLSVGVLGRTFLLVKSGTTLTDLLLGDHEAALAPVHPLTASLFGVS